MDDDASRFAEDCAFIERVSVVFWDSCALRTFPLRHYVLDRRAMCTHEAQYLYRRVVYIARRVFVYIVFGLLLRYLIREPLVRKTAVTCSSLAVMRGRGTNPSQCAIAQA